MYVAVPSDKRTSNSHTSALPNISSYQDTGGVEATSDSEIGLDGDQKEVNMVHNDESTRSRGTQMIYFY